MTARKRAGLMTAFVLLAGCFQAEAPAPAARPESRAMEKDASNPERRIMALAEQPDVQTIPALEAIVQGGVDPAERREAVYALADVGGESNAAAIADALRDPDDGVRRAAIDVLSTMDGEVSAGLLTGALNDADPRIRLAAVDAFGDMEGPTATMALQQALADPDATIREAATELLAERSGGR